MQRPIVLLVLAACALLLPGTAAADEPQPVHRYSDDRLPPPSARVNLLLTGTAVTAGFYGAALGSSYLWPETRGSEHLRIPVAGPWMTLSKTQLCDRDENAPSNCSDFTRVLGAILFALDGVGQAGGVALILQGIFMRTAPLSQQAASVTRVPEWQRPYVSQTHHGKAPWTFATNHLEISARPIPVAGADLSFGLVGKF